MIIPMREPPEEQIRRTIARYCMLCDDGRFEEWADLFDDDARFHVMGRTYEGKGVIRAFIEKGQAPDLRGKHLCGSPLIIEDGFGGHARAWTDFAFVSKSNGISSAGRYHDHLLRGGDDRWRFTLREIVFTGDAPELTDPPVA